MAKANGTANGTNGHRNGHSNGHANGHAGREPFKPTFDPVFDVEEFRRQISETNEDGDRARIAHGVIRLRVNELVNKLMHEYPGQEQVITAVLEGTAMRVTGIFRARERAERQR